MHEIADTAAAIAAASKQTPEEIGEFIQDVEFGISKAQMAVLEAEKELNDSPQAVAVRNAKEKLKGHQATLDAVKWLLLEQILSSGLAEVVTAKGTKFAVRTSPGALEIVDEAKLKEMRGDLFVEKVTVTPDKKAIKAEVEAGRISTDWAIVKRTQTLSVTPA